jgi:hypothetical protein
MSARLALRLLALGLWTAPVAVRAQAVVSGVVRDSTGAAIAGAAVAITALNRSAETDAQGAFRLENVLVGMRMLSVRRIGYSPFSKLIAVAEGENAIPPIVLGQVITKLDTVVTEEQTLWREDPLLREMADNMKIGLGHFVLRPALEKLTGMHVSVVFEQQLGLQVVTDGRGHAWVAKRRGVSSFSTECVRLEDKTGLSLPLGAECSPRFCWPKIYLDNQPLSTVRNAIPEINQFLPENLEAIEMYDGGAQTPARYNTLDSQCGVVVFHSRKYLRKGR